MVNTQIGEFSWAIFYIHWISLDLESGVCVCVLETEPVGVILGWIIISILGWMIPRERVHVKNI